MSCRESSLYKYIKRPSPPYPANKCPNKIKKGNNGKMWVSKAGPKGIYTWRPLEKSGSTKKHKSIRKKRGRPRGSRNKKSKSGRKKRGSSNKDKLERCIQKVKARLPAKCFNNGKFRQLKGCYNPWAVCRAKIKA